uniref:Uncharacterized protein n=1 Tax=Acrobeloides nanus TaxID=290746 RepID=A0A914E7S4_9BILA
MKAIHGPTSSIIDFRRACVVTYQVDPDKSPEAIKDFFDEVPVGSLNECAYLCYQSACRNAVFVPGTVGSLNECAYLCYQSACRNAVFVPGTGDSKGICKTSTSGHEDCSGRLQRHYSYKTDKITVLSCVRCVGERPVTLSPDALFPRPTHPPSLIEESTTLTVTLKKLENETSILPEIGLTTAGEELPPDVQKIESTTINADLLSSSTNADLLLSSTNADLLSSSTNADLLSSSTDADLLSSSTNADLLSSSTNADLLSSSTNADLLSNSTNDDLLLNSTNADPIKLDVKEEEKKGSNDEAKPLENKTEGEKLLPEETLKLRDDTNFAGIGLEENAGAKVETKKEENADLIEPKKDEVTNEVKKENSTEATPEIKEVKDENALQVEKKEIEEAKNQEFEKEKILNENLKFENANTNLTELVTEATLPENITTEILNSTETEIPVSETTITLDPLISETPASETTTLDSTASEITTSEVTKQEITTQENLVQQETSTPELSTTSPETTAIPENETSAPPASETTSSSEPTPALSLTGDGNSTFTTISASNESIDITTLAATNETVVKEEKNELLEAHKQADVPLEEKNNDLLKKSLDVVPTAAGVKTSVGKIEEAHKDLNAINKTEANVTITTTVSVSPKSSFDFQRGCLITFQADPLEERPSEFRSAFELLIDTKAPEICATRCYQDGCTGALYFPHNGTCILGYGDRHYCTKRPLVKFLKFSGSDELVWLHCVGC